MNFSKYQESIFSFVKDSLGHGIVYATAGSGKTFTLIETMKLVQGKVMFLAFNKSIALELASKAPAHVECSTLHSAGLKVLTSAFGKVKVEFKKTELIMDKYQPLQVLQSYSWNEKSRVFEDRKQVKALVTLVKNSLVDYTDLKAVGDIADHFGVEFDSYNLPHVKYVVEKSISMTNVIDFDDMIWLPVVKKLEIKNVYDWLLIDESQDLNRSQIELVLSLVKKPNGRIIAVGDPKQSIYGFRGADSKAMERIQDALKATELPLSVCYRCPSSHLDMAREIVPQIENRDDAPIGILETISDKEFINSVCQENNPLILSRTNAIAVGNALKMIGKGFRATVNGRDFGKLISDIVKKMKPNTIEELFSKVNSWRNNEYEKLDKRQASASAYDVVDDKANCIYAIANNCKTISEFTNALDNLFSDDNKNGFVFSTIHRAKGLENNTVYVFTEKLPLIRKGQKDWEIEQELNLKYVALTRSKNKMVLVTK
jgi:superfamily I DNA/RNA helicase